ncbi:AAA family ATPase [Serratia fonticola]|uniref:AAA family ATPase n=1 Tax=Serratia fonticola TaxID=47917 RepID=UPI0027EA15F9|nr:AAA family ATPase [Serratia fonticola]MDQ7212300.1 AAA family ATPase [Serratia fonticola]HBE9082333.1 AAA family ATPase [Serratia fonticola]HBE9092998.1 AAA family ATPase [Serratia fonticola]HBE9155168.1 AAA family ATPase [Serratia fonticola]
MSVLADLQRLMARNSYSQKQVADQTKLSTTTISQYLNGTYPGNIEKVEAAITNLISREDEKSRNRKVRAEFVKTRLASKCLARIRDVHLDGDIGVIYGSAGMGKSMVMQQYANMFKDVILIEADPGYTTKVLLQELCDRLGVNKRGNIHELSENCISALQGTGWVVLIDEAELLPYRALEVLRRIHDRSGSGVVLAGMPRLLLNLKGRRGEYAQLYSRVGIAIDLDTEQKKTESEDFDNILTSLLPNDEDYTRVNGLFEAFRKHYKGNYRRLFKLARGVVRASSIGDQGISPALVEEYSGMLIH